MKNFVLITADSTRYDTAIKATLPFLKSKGRIRQAYSQGTYTWASHMSMMVGLLPNCREEEPLYNRFIKQLWRIGERPNIDHTKYTEVVLPGKNNIVTSFNRIGYQTIGTGGVSWFKHEIRKEWFSKFEYINNANDQINWVKANLNINMPFFLFINFRETHEPYSFGDKKYEMPKDYLLQRLGKGPITPELFNELHQRQILALEYLDKKIYELCSLIPENTLIVFTSDHGECLGEDNLFGHGFYHPKVMEVPMLIFENKKNRRKTGANKG